MKNGFTLIELLVVVLIIGILASIAVPQYQKAVERSRAVQAITLLKSVGQAYESHHLATGTWANSFDELAVNIPWTGNTKFLSFEKDTRSNGKWSLGIENSGGYTILRVGKIEGKYKGAEFHITFVTPTSGILQNPIMVCSERKSNANFVFDANLPQGAYCEKIIQGTYRGEDTWTRSYKLP
ncbi:MAG: prepilin-type N-terminal cleavage/methylation domain-containing protein [Elusimicrobiaceae bacterium]|nr:prepilin-type N-terminal cleavage/methylation domain-containing protein [Elusimicrobiaceae bacterium]